jgi:ribosomal-protein-alanine N-acetyltransferase
MIYVDRLKTDRLIGKRLTSADVDHLHLMNRTPDVVKTLGGQRTDEGVGDYLQRNIDHWEQHGYGLWMLSLRETGEFVGRAVLRHLHVAGNDEIEIGYALMPEYWGKGFATEIASKIVAVAFSEVGLTDVVAIALPTNRGSRNVMEKVGLSFECDTTYEGNPQVLYRMDNPS